MIDTTKDLPHVETIESGTQNVDVLELSLDEFKKYLNPEKFVGAGQQMIAFEHPENPENIVLIPMFNVAGSNIIKPVLQELINKNKYEGGMKFSLKGQDWKDKGEYEKWALRNSEKIVERVAAHNALFRRGDFTVNGKKVRVFPINTILKVNNENAGIVMKKIEGSKIDDTPENREIVFEVAGDRAVKNARLQTDHNGNPIFVIFDTTSFKSSSDKLGK